MEMELEFQKLGKLGYVYSFDGKYEADNCGSLMLLTKDVNGINAIDMNKKYKFILGEENAIYDSNENIKRQTINLSYNEAIKIVSKNDKILSDLLEIDIDVINEEKTLINFFLLVDILKSANLIVFK